LFRTPFPFLNSEQWILLPKQQIRLTAAGTVPDSHRIPILIVGMSFRHSSKPKAGQMY